MSSSARFGRFGSRQTGTCLGLRSSHQLCQEMEIACHLALPRLVRAIGITWGGNSRSSTGRGSSGPSRWSPPRGSSRRGFDPLLTYTALRV